MANQTAPHWISFSKRSPEIKRKVEEIFGSYANKELYRSAEELYDDMEWGKLNQADLYRGLIESSRQHKCLTFNEMIDIIPPPVPEDVQPGYIEDEFDDTTLVDLAPNDVEGKSLSWFVAHPPTQEIGFKASDVIDQRILDLYVTHVNETGETYFPQLESQLRAYYEMIANQ
jgi:hypothetical protein